MPASISSEASGNSTLTSAADQAAEAPPAPVEKSGLMESSGPEPHYKDNIVLWESASDVRFLPLPFGPDLQLTHTLGYGAARKPLELAVFEKDTNNSSVGSDDVYVGSSFFIRKNGAADPLFPSAFAKCARVSRLLFSVPLSPTSQRSTTSLPRSPFLGRPSFSWDMSRDRSCLAVSSILLSAAPLPR